MNGQFGISSRLAEWTPEMRRHATENIAAYKRLRQVIAGADVYHLTPPPAAGSDPAGWMALQYVTADRNRSLVMTYRLGRSQSEQIFHLKGLDSNRSYRLMEDGRERGVFTGTQLRDTGLSVSLPEQWRSAMIEVEAKP